MPPSVSVIIPTHRRADILAECLRHIECQTIVGDIEVIAVSDGHDDKTAALFGKSAWRMPVTFLEILKSQQGIARNVGLQKASGTVVLFIGDDIFLAPDACEKHLAVHRSVQMPLAVLGFTTWDPSVGITPVMQWLESSGWQFGYPLLRPYAHSIVPIELQHRCTYTSHISLPLSIAKQHLFRTDVYLYGWEDIEWGMRLTSAGVRMYYEPKAHAFHHHHIEMADSLRRMEILGRSARDIAANVPEFDRLPKSWKLLGYKLASLLPTMAGRHRKAFLSGVKSV